MIGCGSNTVEEIHINENSIDEKEINKIYLST
jgi:hypothetical protein